MSTATKMSNYLENKLLDHWLVGNSYTPPTTTYLAIGTTEASDTDQTSWGGEFTGTGYVRQPLSFHPAKSFDTGMTYSAIDEDVEFTSGGGWGTANYFTIWDDETGGNILFRGQLREGVNLNTSGEKLNINKDELRVWLQSTTYSCYLLRKLLDLVLRADSFPVPNKYAALCFTIAGVDDDGSELDEPQGSGYTRILHNTWNLTANSSTNDGNISFPTATSDYEDYVRAMALADASTDGNLLCLSMLELPFGSPGSPPGHEVLLNDVPRILDTWIDVTIE